MEDGFSDGFREGWKAIKGGNAGVPGHGVYASTRGRTAFQEGIRRAVKKALERQGFEEAADAI